MSIAVSRVPGTERVVSPLELFFDLVSWGANWLEPDRRPVRLMLVGLMFAA